MVPAGGPRHLQSQVLSMDSALAATLARRWFYSTANGSEDGYFANHCSYCGRGRVFFIGGPSLIRRIDPQHDEHGFGK
jgi:hypothetical protein